MFMDANELRRFIVQAKTNTYATGEATNAQSSRLGTKDFLYEEGNYKYLDSYAGGLDFAGQELVWEDEKAIWAMNYYGTTFNNIEGFPDFLFESLMLVTKANPYRGPEQHTNGQFEYICSWSGEINRFSGEEKILSRGEVIYQLSFHGGIIRY